MRNWLARLFSSSQRSKIPLQRRTKRLVLDRLEDRLAPAITPFAATAFDSGLNYRYPGQAEVSAALGMGTPVSPLGISVATPTQSGPFNNNVTVTGQLSGGNGTPISLVYQEAGGSAVPVALNGTQFSFTTPFALNGTDEGGHTLTLTATNTAGQQTSTQVFVRIDTVAPTIATFDLAAASDSAPTGDHATTAATISLTGRTEAGARVILANTSAKTTADANGNFSFSGLALPATTTFRVFAFDAAGNRSAGFSRTITRATGNPVVTVNASTTNDTTPTITGTVDSATTVVVNVNGQNYNATITGTTWSANVTNALAAGTFTVTATATNATGQTGTATGNLVVDLTAPTVAITSTATGTTNSTSIPITVTFSQAVTGFTAAELVPSNGTISNFVAVSGGTTYTATLTPTGPGAVTVNVAAGVAADAAGNANTAASPFSITFDNVAPTATITSTATSPTGLTSIPITIEFSENVSNFTIADLSATNGTLGTLVAIDGNTYTTTVTPIANGPVTVNLAANAVQDAAGNNNPAATFSITADSGIPSVSILANVTGPTNQATIPITIVFSEAVTGFVEADVTTTNGTLSNFVAVNTTTYTAVLTPTATGTAQVNVAANVALDSANNGNTAGSFSIVVDYSAPTVTITSGVSGLTNLAQVPITITFSEDVSNDFAFDDVTLSNALIGNFIRVDARTYTATISPFQDGVASVSVGAGIVHDAAGNDNVASNTFQFTSDRTAPTAQITSTASNPTGLVSFPITITFNEDVTGLAPADFTVTNGTLSNLTATNARVYTATLTPGVSGLVRVDLAAGAAQDTALNASAAATFSITYNSVPNVFITSTTQSPTNDASFPITIEFSKDVNNFVAGDIVVTNGTLSGFTAVDANTYTATVTPIANGEVKVDVPAGVAQDSGSNNNLAGTFSMIFDTVAPTVAVTSTAPNPTNLTSIPITITFNEAVVNFTAGDVVVGNGTISNFTGSGTTYTATVTPTGSGTVTIDIAAAAAQDAAGNDNAVAPQFSRVVDVTVPSATITSSAGAATNVQAIPITITFSEDVFDFSAAGITVTNGTLSNFVAANGTTYNATVTATGEGPVTIDVAAGAAHDAVNNLNTAATSTIQYDVTAPTVSITSSAGSLTNLAAIPITIVFSEVVTGFTDADLVFANGTLGTFTPAGDGKTFNATIIPTADGTVTADIAVGAAEDAAGNDSAAATTFSTTSDRTVPTVAITSTTSSPTNLTSFSIDIVFSEVVTGLVAGDFVVTNGAVSNLTTVDGQNYTATLTPAADGTVQVDLPANAAQDGATNGNAAASTFSIVSNLPPGVVIGSQFSGSTNAAVIPITITFTENVNGFLETDVIVTNGTLSNFQIIDGKSFSADITPTADGTVTVEVPAAVAQDTSGLDNTADTFTIVSDRVVPTAMITTTAGTLTNLASIPITITFNEDVSGLALEDFVVANGTLSNLTAVTDARVYQAFLAPTADGVVSIDLTASTVQDSAGNANTAASFSVTSDRTAPAASISAPVVGSTNLSSFSIRIEFGEDVSGMVEGDVVVTNGTLSNFVVVDDKTYDAVVTPTANGLVTISVAAGVASDDANNPNTADTYSVTYDSFAPTAVISSNLSPATNQTTIPITITFNESVNSFTAGDVSVINGTLSNFAGSGTTYTATITPTAAGAVTVDIAAAVAQDDAGNDNLAATQFSIVYDVTAPTPTISAVASPTNLTSVPITITFDEAVVNFTAADVVVGNGTLSNFAGSGTTYTATITPTANGQVTVDIPAAAAKDVAGNDSIGASTRTFTFDGSAPTPTISSTASFPTNGAFTITVTFDEDVSDFTAADVAVGNGTLSNFAFTDARHYTATVTPTSTGTVTVDVAANGAQDTAGNGNAAATTFSREADLTSPATSVFALVGSPTKHDSFLITIDFFENVTGLELGDFTVGNGVISNLTSTNPGLYSALITPNGDGLVTVDLAAGAAQDAAGNLSLADSMSITADYTAPTVDVVLTPSGSTNSNSIAVTITFSEAVPGFSESMVTVTNGTLSNFVANGNQYTATLTPTANGTVTVGVAAGAIQDAAGNNNTADSASVVYDNVAPTVQITTTESDPTSASPIPFFIEFSEDVVNFVAADVTIGNGTVANFVVTDANSYVVYVTPSAPGLVTIDVAAAVAKDAAGNDNTAATQLTITAST